MLTSPTKRVRERPYRVTIPPSIFAKLFSQKFTKILLIEYEHVRSILDHRDSWLFRVKTVKTQGLRDSLFSYGESH